MRAQKRTILACAISALATVGALARGAEIHVHPTFGSDAPPDPASSCGIAPGSGACRTIQGAYDVAASGDVIVLGPGAYNTDRDRNVGDAVFAPNNPHDRVFTKSNVTIATRPLPELAEDPAATSAQAWSVDLDNATLWLEVSFGTQGVAITGPLLVSHGAGRSDPESSGPAAGRGGCLRVTRGSSVDVIDVTFASCAPRLTASDDSSATAPSTAGGAVYVESAWASFTRCTFLENAAVVGGAAWVGGPQPYGPSPPAPPTAASTARAAMTTFAQCAFERNTCEGPGGRMGSLGYGGAVAVEGWGEPAVEGGITAALVDASMAQSRCGGYGGSAAVLGTGAAAFVRASWEETMAGNAGGALFLTHNARAVVLGGRAAGGAHAMDGGFASATMAARLDLLHATLEDAAATHRGGALSAGGYGSANDVAARNAEFPQVKIHDKGTQTIK